MRYGKCQKGNFRILENSYFNIFSSGNQRRSQMGARGGGRPQQKSRAPDHKISYAQFFFKYLKKFRIQLISKKDEKNKICFLFNIGIYSVNIFCTKHFNFWVFMKQNFWPLKMRFPRVYRVQNSKMFQGLRPWPPWLLGGGGGAYSTCSPSWKRSSA